MTVAEQDTCGVVRIGSLTGVQVCGLPNDHGGEWHQAATVGRMKWPVERAVSDTSANGGEANARPDTVWPETTP